MIFIIYFSFLALKDGKYRFGEGLHWLDSPQEGEAEKESKGATEFADQRVERKEKHFFFNELVSKGVTDEKLSLIANNGIRIR